MDEPTLFPLPAADGEVGSGGVRGGVPRVVIPERTQVEWRPLALDQLLPSEHRARVVWGFVEGLDLSRLYSRIVAVEGEVGRPAIDPRLLLALWLYATLEGVGSARALDRLCSEHVAYMWLCGGVSVNYHTLADFRVQHSGVLDDLLTQNVAALVHAGVVDLSVIAQDGKKVRASAGASSFRREPRLEWCLKEARRHVRRLRTELDSDPSGPSRRERSARERALRERQERVEAALAGVKEIEQARKEQRRGGSGSGRVSTTDPEARVMKMGDGGYRPAYNVQYATAVSGGVVVGVEVTKSASDMGQLVPMVKQVRRRGFSLPQVLLADGNYAKKADVAELAAPPFGCAVIAPVHKPKTEKRGPYTPHHLDPPGVAAWRERMGTKEAKDLYRQRAATAEWVNAQVHNRGFNQVNVRGQEKVRCVALWHALAHNLLQGQSLLARVAGS